jgi:hypothetical protein
MLSIKRIVVQAYNMPDIIFNGRLLASMKIGDGSLKPLKLFITEKGNYVCQKLKAYTLLTKVCENHYEVIEFFGNGELAKELYKEAGISDSIWVD